MGFWNRSKEPKVTMAELYEEARAFEEVANRDYVYDHKKDYGKCDISELPTFVKEDCKVKPMSSDPRTATHINRPPKDSGFVDGKEYSNAEFVRRSREYRASKKRTD